MKLIIDVSKETYDRIRDINRDYLRRSTVMECVDTIYNGIPLEDITDGIESHKWGNNEGSKEIYNNAIDDVLTYIEEKLGE